MLSFTEENYLKSLIQLTIFTDGKDEVGVNRMAESLGVKPATVSDMVRKLKDKGLVNYQRYGKVSLTLSGRAEGMMVIRRHRLWETFLQEKLGFSWDEVHELAEELEHIHSKKLVDRLDSFLDYPAFDPHGDAIPNADGEIIIPFRRTLLEGEAGKSYRLVAVKDNSPEFLKYVDRLGLAINDEIEVLSYDAFDSAMSIKYKGETRVVSPKFTENVYIVCSKCNKAKDCSC